MGAAVDRLQRGRQRSGDGPVSVAALLARPRAAGCGVSLKSNSPTAVSRFAPPPPEALLAELRKPDSFEVQFQQAE